MKIHGLDWSFQLSPFWTAMFILVTAVIVLLVLYLDARSISRQNWHCPQCNKAFTPKWYKCLFTPHVGQDHLLRCPHCGNKNLCWKAQH